MQTLTYAFWACVILALGAAFSDCARRPDQTAKAWKHFRPVALFIGAIAVGFLGVNLFRTRLAHAEILIPQTLQLVGVAVFSSIFFCGGWRWASRSGRSSLLAQLGVPSSDPRPPTFKRRIAETVLLCFVAVGFSAAFLYATNPKPSSSFQQWIDSLDRWNIRSGYFILALLLFPVWEETVFRWYILNRLEMAFIKAAWGRPAAVILSAAFWAFGHAAFTEPVWVKLVQIFAIGCLLGWMFRRIGLTGCVVVHLAVNLFAIIAGL